MKNQFTILTVFIFFVLIHNSFSWENGGVFEIENILNPYNDKELVVLGHINWVSDLYTNVIDLTTGKITQTQLVDNSSQRAEINGSSKRIASMGNGKINIYNYIDNSKISVISTSYDFKNTNIKVSFSKEGNLIYIFNKDEMRLLVYDVSSGIKKDELLINSNPIFYSDAFINGAKDEFALRKKDSLEFWSIGSKSINRTIYFDINAKLVKFGLEGERISYINNSNVIFNVNSKDGIVVFQKVVTKYSDNYEFSADMNILLYGDYKSNQTIYSIKTDKIINRSSKDGSKFYSYITSDFSTALGYEEYNACTTDMPYKSKLYFIYDLQKEKKIAPLVHGFVCLPHKIVINEQNNLLAVQGTNGNYKNPFYYTALVDGNGKLIKYINTDKHPHAFSINSDYLLLSDSNKVLFYNIAKDTIDKVLETNLIGLSNIFCISAGSDLIVTYDYLNINVYNYSDLSLKSSLKFNTKIKSRMYLDKNGNIIYVDSASFYSFNPTTGKVTSKTLTNLPNNFNPSGLSPDANYILIRNSSDSFCIYKIDEQKVIYSYKINDYVPIMEFSGSGFMGSRNLIYFSYITDPINQWNRFYLVDIRNGSVTNLMGTTLATISKNGQYYASIFECGLQYSFNKQPVPDKVEDLVNRDESMLLSPNPASDYITIQPSEILKLSAGNTVQIFDVLGIPVSEIQQIISNNRINIQYLLPGVYFVKIGNLVGKFVKI